MAASQLGVGIDGVDYEIMEEGTKGFLGLGQTPTLISAWVREGYERGSSPPPAGPAPVAEKREEEAEEQPEAVEVYDEEAALEEVEERDEMAAVEPAADGRGFTGALVGILNDVIAAMGLEVRPQVISDTKEEVVVELLGKDVAILIGKRGQTLDALQYLVSIAANKPMSTSRRVILDAEGYRQRHREMLERKARDLAQAVKEAGQEAVFEPQSARDRRIIHLALASDPDVYTYSEGEGEDRHVVISPKK